MQKLLVIKLKALIRKIIKMHIPLHYNVFENYLKTMRK